MGKGRFQAKSEVQMLILALPDGGACLKLRKYLWTKISNHSDQKSFGHLISIKI